MWIYRLEDYRDKLSASPTHQINNAMMVTKALMNLLVEWSMTRQEIWRLPLNEQTWEHVCQILQAHNEIVNLGRTQTTEPSTGDANVASSQFRRGRGGRSLASIRGCGVGCG